MGKDAEKGGKGWERGRKEGYKRFHWEKVKMWIIFRIRKCIFNIRFG